MALLLETGVAGTGKTLYAIQKHIIPELKSGGVVYTNIDGLIPSRIAIFYNMDVFTVEKNIRQIKDVKFFYKEIEKNAMVVLDEAQNIFNNRDWQSTANSELIKYLMEHRHYGHKLVFVTPHIDSLDAGIKRVAEFTYKHKSYSALGRKGQVTCAIFDQANLTREPLQIFKWSHDERIYNCYKSYFQEGTVEKKPRVYPLKNPMLYFLVILTTIMIVFSIRGCAEFQKKISKKSVATDIKSKDIVKLPSKKILINGVPIE